MPRPSYRLQIPSRAQPVRLHLAGGRPMPSCARFLALVLFLGAALIGCNKSTPTTQLAPPPNTGGATGGNLPENTAPITRGNPTENTDPIAGGNPETPAEKKKPSSDTSPQGL